MPSIAEDVATDLRMLRSRAVRSRRYGFVVLRRERMARQYINPYPRAARITMKSSALEIAVTHLNAPVGQILTVEQLTQALRTGTVAGLEPQPAALVSYLFIELEGHLIASCAAEAGASLPTVNQLYEESVRGHLPRVPAWEEAVAHLV